MQDVLKEKATDFIRRSATANDNKPFFMWMPTYSPHGPATPAPRHADTYPNAQAPRPPTFNQPDVSGYPQWLQNRPALTEQQIAQIDALYRKRLQSMLAVEHTLQAIVETLREARQLENTYIFFSSDNGFHLGQHRLNPGKNTEFEEDLRVPLLVRGPGVPAGQVREHLTVNIDLAPTFAELAGVPVPDLVDARSLVPLLPGDPLPVGQWRQAFLLEHGFLETEDSGHTSADAPSLQEPPDLLDRAPARMPPPFVGLHTSTLAYFQYPTTGERELYNLVADPYEQTSIAETADPKRVTELAAWLERLRTCAGAQCRSVEVLTLP